MKNKIKYFIPIYGMFKYFHDYFRAERRDTKDAEKALWMELYHHITGLIILLPPIIYLLQK